MGGLFYVIEQSHDYRHLQKKRGRRVQCRTEREQSVIGWAESLGLDRRKARQNRLKTEEMCTKVGKRTTNWENAAAEERCHTKAIYRPQQKLEISKIANASTFRQVKRRLHAQGPLLKSILA